MKINVGCLLFWNKIFEKLNKSVWNETRERQSNLLLKNIIGARVNSISALRGEWVRESRWERARRRWVRASWIIWSLSRISTVSDLYLSNEQAKSLIWFLRSYPLQISGPGPYFSVNIKMAVNWEDDPVWRMGSDLNFANNLWYLYRPAPVIYVIQWKISHVFIYIFVYKISGFTSKLNSRGEVPCILEANVSKLF